MKALALVLLVLLAGTLFLVVGGLLANRLPLLESPGLRVRLKTYFGENVAETRPDSPFHELRAPFHPVSEVRLYEAVRTSMAELGWESVSGDPERGTVRAVVSTPIWRFKDDVSVQVVPGDDGTSTLHVRAASRLGKGDLGANTRHVMDLLATLETVLRRQGDAEVSASP